MDDAILRTITNRRTGGDPTGYGQRATAEPGLSHGLPRPNGPRSQQRRLVQEALAMMPIDRPNDDA